MTLENKENRQKVEIGKVKKKMKTKVKVDVWKTKTIERKQKIVIEKEEGKGEEISEQRYEGLRDISNFIERKEKR